MKSIDKVFEIIIKDLEKNKKDFAKDVINKGFEATYINEDGLIVKEFPDGKIYHIDFDVENKKTIYLKRLK